VVTVDGSGNASLTTTTLAAGDHVILAKYKGDSNFASSTSATLTEKVGAVISGDGGAEAGAPIDDDAGSLGELGQPSTDDGPGCSVSSESAAPGFGSLLAIVGLGALLGRRRSKKR
jgi:MYXO-CTERM domain-containing protein